MQLHDILLIIAFIEDFVNLPARETGGNPAKEKPEKTADPYAKSKK